MAADGYLSWFTHQIICLEVGSYQLSELPRDYLPSFHSNLDIQLQGDSVWFQLAGGLISYSANLKAIKLLFNIWPNMNNVYF